MCGIAGYCLSPESPVDRTLAAQALLAGIAERGADAVGYAWRAGDPAVTVHKQRTGASALLDEIDVPASALQVLVHVRDYTKGHPTIPANNHPIRHGAVVGVHNGVIRNDEDILAAHGIARAEREMTVDSEAILALAELADSRADALEELHGSMAAAWLDERRPETVFLARGIGRPLWLGWARREVFFASTRAALELVERTLRTTLTLREVDDGTLLRLARGRVAGAERFSPDRTFVERPLPAVRAPHEGVSCLKRLTAIAAAALPS
jgi:glucosamine 6-phosphate synthetase-like amidotransferase/phosphosugar isomerase protein